MGLSISWDDLNFVKDANSILIKYIDSGEPFCLVRPGSAEMSFVCWWIEGVLFKTSRYKLHQVYKMFDEDNLQAKRWVKQFEQDLNEADIYASLGNKKNYLIDWCCKDKIICSANILGLGQETDSWLWKLADKKVLIVSPFSATMKQQMYNIDKIWRNDHFLKHTDLRFQQSVWYTGKNQDTGGFSSWFEAYEYLKQEVLSQDFDIALLSCGPFSTFLAADIKRNGRSAIQYGGVLQLMFGIRGKRWDDNIELQSIYNEYWVRPGEAEKPRSDKSIKDSDDGCYW